MKISTRGRYALRIMIDLALNGKDEYTSLKDISIRQEISMKYLEQIISNLNKERYVKSLRGTAGGYKLTKAPKEYKVGDILRTVEGSLAPINCIDGECNRKKECKTFSFWEGLDNVIEQYVDSKTLEDLMK